MRKDRIYYVNHLDELKRYFIYTHKRKKNYKNELWWSSLRI